MAVKATPIADPVKPVVKELSASKLARMFAAQSFVPVTLCVLPTITEATVNVEVVIKVIDTIFLTLYIFFVKSMFFY